MPRSRPARSHQNLALYSGRKRPRGYYGYATPGKVPGNSTRYPYMGRGAFTNTAPRTYRIRSVGTISSNTLGAISRVWKPSDLSTANPPDFDALKSLYDQYKVIGIMVQILPYNVGVESASVGGFVRGNTATYVDMDGTSLPADIGKAMEYSSSRLEQSREPIFRSLRIPPDQRTQWNDLGAGFDADNKESSIGIIGDQFSVSSQVFYFAATYIMLVQGRR